MLEGLSGVLIAIAGSISKKATIIGLAMLLIFLLGTASTINSFGLVVGVITGLAIFYTICQSVVEIQISKNKDK